MTSYRLDPPILQWDANGAPLSNQFDDVYFDRQSGLEETEFVFLQHNNLKDRFQQLLKSNEPAFTIAETGFGTGLNFLCAWQLWQNCIPADSNKRLHFISVEKFPLTKEELTQALKIWPSLKPLAEELIESYPILCHGIHRIELQDGQIQLTLWFGDANEGFSQINADVDAWFLDGFAPSKNPEMWNPTLFEEIQRLSHIGTSVATFTAAGIVRRGLQSVGFDMQKVKGFGKKREMMIGVLQQQSQTYSQRATSGLAWFNNRIEDPINLEDSHVLVVGAGLAGCHTANALAKKGIKVTIWDQHSEVACEASGNPQGILYPKLANYDSAINRFYLTSYLHSYRQLSQLDNSIWGQTGLEQRPASPTEQERFENIIANKLYPETVVKSENQHTLFLPLSGWVKPAQWCQQLIQHKNITFVGKRKLTGLQYQRDNGPIRWQASYEEDDKSESFSHIILCTAHNKTLVDTWIELPIKSIRGQVSTLPVTDDFPLDRVLCQSGYVSPPLKGQLHFGSTYGLKDTNAEVTKTDHAENLEKLTELIPEFDWQSRVDECIGRVSFRCTVTDYMPFIGPIPDIDSYKKHYAFLEKNAKKKSDQIADNIPNLYLNIGHGSRGLISTPLAGDYLAALICNETSVYERQIEHILHPARFLVRGLKRGTL